MNYAKKFEFRHFKGELLKKYSTHKTEIFTHIQYDEILNVTTKKVRKSNSQFYMYFIKGEALGNNNFNWGISQSFVDGFRRGLWEKTINHPNKAKPPSPFLLNQSFTKIEFCKNP